MKPFCRSAGGALLALAVIGTCFGTRAHADDDPAAVLELRFTPAPRAQIAIWIEDASGRFIRTLGLTQAVAYRGIGNRPGASLMNSGYRWPYGRREGVLPIWASRRASAPGARQFRRVIFQNRSSEGLASRTSNDQSRDDYFCLSFNRDTTTQDALDAVSCASVFASDKGRFLTNADVSAGYAEPWQDPGSSSGRMAALPIASLYPPRMDIAPCLSGDCFDHADSEDFAAHARAVMPEIDEVTMATPPGMVEQSMLFSIPADWPAGTYSLWIEVGVEGDYNSAFGASTFPTPDQPADKWDTWAETYGYPYRGQPSVVYQLSFEHQAPGDADYGSRDAVGRSSWSFWDDDYGKLESLTNMTDDHQSAMGSGVDRLVSGSNGQRVSLHVETLLTPPPPDASAPDPFMMDPTVPEDPAPVEPVPTGGDAGSAGSGDSQGSAGEGAGASAGATGASSGDQTAPDDETAMPSDAPATSSPQTVPPADENDEAVILLDPGSHSDSVGPIRQLKLGRHPDELHAHEWITVSFLAARSETALHDYEVRVASEPISDATSFIRNGRPAKTATLDAEGAVSLMLDAGIAAGQPVHGAIGDLVAETHYYIAVRATDRLNRHGPISVAQITTPKRVFATVTPCFVATAAYGSPLASEVGSLRRVRDRFLLSTAPGRALVHAYYRRGAVLAAELREHAWLRPLARAALRPIVTLAHHLQGDD